jgi:hypothetical protein
MDSGSINSIFQEWIKTIFSYPLVLLVVILIFRSEIKNILASISHLKLGNIEIRMKDMKEEIKRDMVDYLTDKLVDIVSQKEPTSPEKVKSALEVLDIIERPGKKQTKS